MGIEWRPGQHRKIRTGLEVTELGLTSVKFGPVGGLGGRVDSRLLRDIPSHPVLFPPVTSMVNVEGQDQTCALALWSSGSAGAFLTREVWRINGETLAGTLGQVWRRGRRYLPAHGARVLVRYFPEPDRGPHYGGMPLARLCRYTADTGHQVPPI
jgi:hypothetical protein